MRAEVVKQVTGMIIVLQPAEAREVTSALEFVWEKFEIDPAENRADQPHLKVLYHLYDILKEAGFDQ